MPIQPRLVVVADDLTGATDTGLQFSKVGLRTEVYFDPPLLPGSGDVIAITTESRARPADEARRLVLHAGARIRSWNVSHVYKKIDSTMRGNIGAEVEALANSLDRRLVVLTPAFPANGRTVRNGRVLVNGVNLAASELANEALSPQRHSRVAQILAEQCKWQVVEIGLEQVRSRAAWLSERIERLAATKTPTLVALDAVSPSDLNQIAKAIAGNSFVLPAGSAGLAEWLPQALQMRPSPASSIPQPPSVAAVVVVVGSVNPIARRQLQILAEDDEVSTVKVSADRLVDTSTRRREIDRGARETKHALATRKDVALTFDLEHGADRLATLADGHGLTLQDLTEIIVHSLGNIVARACPSMGRIGLVLTGGDTAIAVCRALGGNGMVVSREVAPGMPMCALVGGDYDGAPVVTKAGGFGTEEALLVALRALKGRPIR